MTFIDWFLTAVAAAAAIPIAVIALETLVALLPGWRRSPTSPLQRPPCAVLIPAHDEEAGIGETLRRLRTELREGDRVMVIADNCTDRTVEVARACGAIVLERNDTEKRGKGFALAYGLDQLASEPPEFVVFLDADSRLTPGSLDLLVAEARKRNGPVQGAFVDAPRRRGPREQWSAFALTFKNLVRPLGLHRLGLPCLLTGSGMAFPWQLIRGVNLGSANIVEDMQLGIDLAVAGHPPRFVPAARIESDDAPTLESSRKRRTRWEHGHVRTLLTQVPRLIVNGLARLRPRLIALAFELSVPPLSLLLLAQAFLAAICIVFWQLGGSYVPWRF